MNRKPAQSVLQLRFLPVLFLALLLVGTRLTFARAAELWEQQARLALEQADWATVKRLSEQRLGNPASAAVAHLLLGIADLRQGRHLPAIEHFQAAQDLGADGEELFEPWSQALQALGRLEKASELLDQALSRNPFQKGLHRRQADLYLAQGKPQRALPHLEQAYQQGLRNAGVILQLASTRFAAGQDYSAVELLGPLVSSASSPNLLLQIGKLYFQNLLYRQAAPPLERAWELSKPSYESGMYLALTYLQLERYADCARILEQMRPDAARAPEYRILKGSALARLGKWEEARSELSQAVASADSRADGYLNLALFWLERGDRQQAWQLLEKGSRLMTPGTKVLYRLGTRQNCEGLRPPQPAEATNRERAELYANLAETFHKTHHWVSALELFLLALEEDPGLPVPYGAIGLICQELGSPEVSEAFLRQGLSLHPNAADLHFYLGTILYATGRHAEAISSYQKALELDGPKPPARHWLFLGIAQAASGNDYPAEARDSFLRAREADPQLALAHYELGKWYLKNQKLDLAEESLQRAIELDPNLVGAYYQYGLACTRNGKTAKGQELMAIFQRKRALREPSPHARTEKAPPPPAVP